MRSGPDAEWMRDYRRREPARAQATAARQRAKLAAALAVARRHAAEFDREYLDQCERRGIAPYAPLRRPPTGGEP